jgi:hypothetical protein
LNFATGIRIDIFLNLSTPWPDIAVAAIVACLGISSAVRVIRQALGEMRETSALHSAPAE